MLKPKIQCPIMQVTGKSLDALTFTDDNHNYTTNNLHEIRGSLNHADKYLVIYIQRQEPKPSKIYKINSEDIIAIISTTKFNTIYQKNDVGIFRDTVQWRNGKFYLEEHGIDIKLPENVELENYQRYIFIVKNFRPQKTVYKLNELIAIIQITSTKNGQQFKTVYQKPGT